MIMMCGVHGKVVRCLPPVESLHVLQLPKWLCPVGRLPPQAALRPARPPHRRLVRLLPAGGAGRAPTPSTAPRRPAVWFRPTPGFGGPGSADYAALREAGRNPFLTIGPWSHFDAGECDALPFTFSQTSVRALPFSVIPSLPCSRIESIQ